MPALRTSLILTSVLALSLFGCSALVDPESLLVQCEARSGAPDPCADLGLTCASGICQRCEPTSELCDGRDNDCDGDVDEGHDADGDGYTWCGGGRPELLDCAPDDPAIHPNNDPDTVSEEPCDGVDNDCDEAVDEGQGPSCDGQRAGARAPRDVRGFDQGFCEKPSIFLPRAVSQHSIQSGREHPLRPTVPGLRRKSSCRTWSRSCSPAC